VVANRAANYGALIFVDTIIRVPVEQDQIKLRELVLTLWEGRIIIVALTALAMIVAAVAAVVLPKTYKASVVISPVTNMPNASGLGGALASQGGLGALSALAGITLGTDSKRAESLTVLQSEALTEQYISKNNLLPELFHGDWDARDRRWNNPAKAPTLWKANQFFKKNVRSLDADKAGMVTMTIAWRNPHLAAEWANGLVALANDYLRNKAIAESERNIAYLNSQAAKTNVVEIRQGIFTLLETEINREMVARGNDEYAFKVLDPAEAPQKAASPRIVLWIAIAAVSGLILSGLIVLGRAAWRRSGED
jgi:LPS O-antigen subunit length determinant protein (WzzB/FepE family)